MTRKQKLMIGAAIAVVATVGCANGPDGRMTAAETPSAPAIACADLAAAALPDATVTLAEAREAGEFAPPGGGGGFGPSTFELPAFCRVAATLTPSDDSNIKMEVWLPTEWNGKFMMVGNGVWSGAISYFAMPEALNRGYAVAGTDTGHEGGRATWAFEHPEWLVDFAWRAVHETAVASQALTAMYYGGGPRLSYWNSCSSGGKQGLKEAQMFPEDFDAMIVGAPANNWVRLMAQSVIASDVNRPEGGRPILGPGQISLLNEAAIAQCDALDGVEDGEIADPRACAFEAESIVCADGQDAATCLTPEQAEVADAIYSSVRNPATDELLMPGFPPGSEPLWAAVVLQPWQAGVDNFAVLLDDPDWESRTLDLSTDIDAAEAADPGMVAMNPDLSAFEARGGKIIQYHGWTDGLIPAENSINYYESVAAEQGGLDTTQDFYRLFMVPAMSHCSGSYDVDWIGALEQWVETDQAPDSVLGRRLPQGGPFGAAPAGDGPDLGARPICAYPEVAVYDGAGSDGDPASFTCQAVERGARPGHAP